MKAPSDTGISDRAHDPTTMQIGGCGKYIMIAAPL